MNIEIFQKYEMNNIPPILLNWIGAEQVENSIRTRLMEDYASLFDEAAAKRFMEKIKHENTCEEDYLTHLLDLGNNRSVMSKIIFRNDKGKLFPFIQIYHKNFDFFSIGKQELETIISRYKAFNPEFIRFYKHDLRENMIIHGYMLKGDSVVAVGHIDTIKHFPKPDKYDEISLEILHDMEFFKTYSTEYDEFFNENDHTKDYLNKETEETMNRLMKKNFVYKVIIENEFAGIFAVDKTKEKYFNSYMVVEEILFKKFRGRGFAAAVQRKVIDNLNAGSEELIFGTIHPNNRASLKTALKNERVLMGTNYLLMLKNNKK